MFTLINYGMQEKLRSKGLYISIIVMNVIISFLLINAQISVDGVPLDSFDLMMIVGLGLVSILSAVLVTALVSGTIKEEFESKKSDLVLAKGISSKVYLGSLILSNSIISFIATTGIGISLIVYAFKSGNKDLVFNIILGLIIVNLVNLVVVSISSFLSIKVSNFLNIVLTIGIYIISVSNELIGSFVPSLEKISDSIPNLYDVLESAYYVMINGNYELKSIIVIIPIVIIFISITVFTKVSK